VLSLMIGQFVDGGRPAMMGFMISPLYIQISRAGSLECMRLPALVDTTGRLGRGNRTLSCRRALWIGGSATTHYFGQYLFRRLALAAATVLCLHLPFYARSSLAKKNADSTPAFEASTPGR